VPQTLAIRHVPFEDLGLLAPLLAERGRACIDDWFSGVGL